MNNEDDLEQMVRDSLRREVAHGAFRLDGLEKLVATELSGKVPRRGVIDFLAHLVAPPVRGRVAQLAVVGVTALVFMVIGAFIGDKLPTIGLFSGGHHPVAAMESTSGETAALFVMPAPGAKSVAVVGDFNGWTPTPLSDPNHDGIWTARIPLPPGRYEYAFIVDGHWWGQDPLADGYVHSFGSYNSVRYIGRVGEGA